MTFKNWLQEKWFEHKDEYMELGIAIPESNLEEYFRRYKWWLKREYKHWRDSNE